MAGGKTGVERCINEIESHAHLVHCHSHTLQLSVGYTIKTIKIIKDTLDTA